MLIFGQRLDYIHGSLAFCLFAFYIFCLFTVAPVTFRKGYTWLGIAGIAFPFLWLVGATLKTKPDSWYAQQQGLAERSHMNEFTR